MPVISHHLLAPVRDVGAHRGQPFQRRKVFGCRAVLRCIDDRPLLIEVSYLALKKTEYRYILAVSDFFVVINNYARPEWHQYNDIV